MLRERSFCISQKKFLYKIYNQKGRNRRECFDPLFYISLGISSEISITPRLLPPELGFLSST
jgi:hypothetical protein